MKIVFLDSFTLNPGDLNWDCFNAYGEFEHHTDTPQELVVKNAAKADVIITNKVKLNETHFAQLPKLKLILVAATGYDVVDTKAARKYNIAVCNCPAYGSKAVAQMVFAHLLEVTNRVGHYTYLNQEEKDWAKQTFFSYWNTPLTEINGKSIAIVGFGNIGKEVARIAHAFEMTVYAVTSRKQSELPEGITKISLFEAMEKCDIVSLSCPLTENNKQCINEECLSHAHPNLIFINTARGGLIDEVAMAKALKENKIKAFCADVLSTEPPPTNHPLLGLKNAFITPHIAWATLEARKRILDILMNNLEHFTKGNPQNVVN